MTVAQTSSKRGDTSGTGPGGAVRGTGLALRFSLALQYCLPNYEIFSLGRSLCGSVSMLAAGLRAAEQAAVPGPALGGVGLCTGGLGQDFAPFRHHVVYGGKSFVL